MRWKTNGIPRAAIDDLPIVERWPALAVYQRCRRWNEAGIWEAVATRLVAVAARRDSPRFTDAERAALALTECVTRLGDRAARTSTL